MHGKSLEEIVWNADNNPIAMADLWMTFFILGFWYFSIFSQHVLTLEQTKWSIIFNNTTRKGSWRPAVKPDICSVTKSCLFETPWTAAHQASLSFTVSQSLLKLMCIESVMPSNHLILCCPLLLLPSGSFPMNQLFAPGDQSTGASALASFLPKKSQDWSPSQWTGWIALFNLTKIKNWMK